MVTIDLVGYRAPCTCHHPPPPPHCRLDPAGDRLVASARPGNNFCGVMHVTSGVISLYPLREEPRPDSLAESVGNQAAVHAVRDKLPSITDLYGNTPYVGAHRDFTGGVLPLTRTRSRSVDELSPAIRPTGFHPIKHQDPEFTHLDEDGEPANSHSQLVGRLGGDQRNYVGFTLKVVNAANFVLVCTSRLLNSRQFHPAYASNGKMPQAWAAAIQAALQHLTLAPPVGRFRSGSSPQFTTP